MVNKRTRGTSAENNTWRRVSPGASTVIVFVHGYFSNADKCWRHANGTYWPDLLEKDPRVPDASVFLAGYYTSVDSGNYGVQDCAREVMAALGREGYDGSPAPISYAKIVFICHSLGGIVARYALEAYRDSFKGKTVGLCLLASPSLGSDYADSFGLIAAIFKNRVGAQLRFFSSFLEDLDDRFVRLLSSDSDITVLGAEAVEHKPIMFGRLPWFRPVVKKVSAARYFEMRRTLPGTNHSSIVKPESLRSQGHEFIVDYFARHDIFSNGQTAPIIAPTSPIRPVDVLFDVYEARLEPYFLVREIDRFIRENCSLRSVWITGASGTGKTCSLKRYTSSQSGEHIHICLSQCGTQAGRQDIVNELAETMAQLLEGSPIARSFAGLIAGLASVESKRIIVYIDEVPSTHEGSMVADALLSLLCELLTTWKQKYDARQLTFVVSSLVLPGTASHANREKLHELFAFSEVFAWDRDSISALGEIITSTLPMLAPETAIKDMLINASNGSPRFLKTVFRILHFGEGRFSPEQAVAQASTQLRP